MSYGFRITGNDTAPFTVLDTELDTLGLVVTEKGRASVINPSYPLGPYDFLFVKNPSAPGNASFDSETQYPAPSTSVTWEVPQYYQMYTDFTTGTITFKGGAYDYYQDPYNPRGLPRLALATGWDVEFDYFIVRRSTDIMTEGLGRDDNYGLQVRSKFYTETDQILAYDSRSAITNDTFYIETYLPPASQVYTPTSQGQGYYSSVSFSSGCYVNINWTNRTIGGNYPSTINFVQAIGMTATRAWAVTGILELEDGGRFFIDGNSTAILAVKLRDPANVYQDTGGTDADAGDQETAPNEDDVDTNYTGSLAYVAGNTFTEGGTIQFDATVNTPNIGYHTKIFRVTGSGDDLDSITHVFTGGYGAERISITANNESVNDSRTVSYMRTQNYVGNYTTTRNSAYSRGFLGNFTGDYSRTFIGDYSRSSSYSRDFIGEYTRLGSYSRIIPSSRNFVGNYQRNRTSSYARGVVYIRNSIFTRTRLAYSQNSFVGNYSRTINVPTAFTRTGYYTGNYQRTRPTEYYINLPGSEGESGVLYVDIVAPAYVGDYTRNFAGNYSRTRLSTFTAGVTYEGNYSRNFQGNFTGNYARDKSYSRNFAGNFIGNYTREFNFTRDSIGAGGTVTSTRSSIGGGNQLNDHYMFSSKTGFRAGWLYRSDTGQVQAWKLGSVIASASGNANTTEFVSGGVTYQRGSYRQTISGSDYYGITYNEGTTSYTGNFTTAPTFTGDFIRESAYTRDRIANRASSYIGPSTYSRTSTRTRVSSYVRNRAASNSRTSSYVGNYGRTRTSNYTRGIFADFTRVSTRTLNFAGNTPTPTDYLRTRVSNYLGNYLGNYNRDLFFTGGVDYSRSFEGNYNRTRNSSYNRPSSYTRDLFYTRTRVSGYARTIPSNRERISAYQRERQSTTGESYNRTFTGNFVGNYIGNYTRFASGSSSGISEVKWRGEQFLIELRVGSAGDALTYGQNDPNSIILDSQTFTLFDNDAGTVLATTGVTVSDTDTTHKLLVDFKSEGNQVASGRITTVAGGVSNIMAGPFDLVDGLNEITVTNAPQVVAGSSVVYYIHVNNNGDGSSTPNYWVPGGQYTVTRVPSNDNDGQDGTPPPDSDGTTPSGPTDPGDPDGPGDETPSDDADFA